MARNFRVGARIEAEDRTQAVDRARTRLDLLGKEQAKLNADFAAGKITADSFSTAMDRLDRESDQLTRSLDAAGRSTQRAEGTFRRFSRFLTSRLVVSGIPERSHQVL